MNFVKQGYHVILVDVQQEAVEQTTHHPFHKSHIEAVSHAFNLWLTELILKY